MVSCFEWRYTAAFVMLFSFGGSVAFALGHHFWYWSLNRSVVQQGGLEFSSFRVSQQQYSIAIGSLLSFFVKALLQVTVATAFDQIAWREVKKRTTELSRIDSLFGVFGNAFLIFHFRLWRHYPLAMFFALIFWLLPVASIVTPATLTVQASYMTDTYDATVPSVDYENTALSFYTSKEDGTNSISWDSASTEVKRVVTATALQGQILPIEPPCSNSSWTIDYMAPSLSCNPVEGQLYDSIVRNVTGAVANTLSLQNGSGSCSFGWLSWVPQWDSTNKVTIDMPLIQDRVNNDTWKQMVPHSQLGIFAEGQPLKIYIAAFPGMLATAPTNLSDYYTATQDNTILDCRLQNTSYTTRFNYTNGEQHVEVLAAKPLHEVVFHNPTSGAVNSSLVESFGYQSVMWAFGNIIPGMVATAHEIGITQLNTLYTHVLETSLSRTKELATITENLDKGPLDILSHYLDTNTSITWRSNNMPLKNATEELFQNITLSLMSSGMFQ